MRVKVYMAHSLACQSQANTCGTYSGLAFNKYSNTSAGLYICVPYKTMEPYHCGRNEDIPTHITPKYYPRTIKATLNIICTYENE